VIAALAPETLEGLEWLGLALAALTNIQVRGAS